MRVAQIVGMLALASGVALSSPLALAAGTGWYGGINVGPSRAEVNDGRINTELQTAGFATAVTATDERDTAYKLFWGYQLNRNFAVEGSYFDLGKFGYASTTTGPAGTLTSTMQQQGVSLDAVGRLPINDKFSALGRVGLTYSEADDHFAGTGGVTVGNPHAKKRSANYKLGVGLQYDMNQSIGLRGEFERYRIKDSAGNRGDVDVYSAGMIVKF